MNFQKILKGLLAVFFMLTACAQNTRPDTESTIQSGPYTESPTNETGPHKDQFDRVAKLTAENPTGQTESGNGILRSMKKGDKPIGVSMLMHWKGKDTVTGKDTSLLVLGVAMVDLGEKKLNYAYILENGETIFSSSFKIGMNEDQLIGALLRLELLLKERKGKLKELNEGEIESMLEQIE